MRRPPMVKLHLVLAAGYDTMHAKYPHCRLGYRVFHIPPKNGPKRPGFSPRNQGAGSYSATRKFASVLLRTSSRLTPCASSISLTPSPL